MLTAWDERELSEDVLVYPPDPSALCCGDHLVPIPHVYRRPLPHPASRVELHADVRRVVLQRRPSVDDVPVALKHATKIHTVSWIVNSLCVASGEGRRYG